MTTTESSTKTETERLAEASGLTEQEVEAHLAAGRLFYRDPDHWGSEPNPGEWLDATGTEYVVAGGGYYGRSNTVVAAKANFRAYGGRLSDGYVVLTFGPGSRFIGIGGMGYHWLGEKPEVHEVPPKGKR